MIENIFYSSKLTVECEKNGKFSQLIKFVDMLFVSNDNTAESKSVVATMIFDTWYAYKMFLETPSTEPRDFTPSDYLNYYFKYVGYGLIAYRNDPAILWIIGFTEAHAVGEIQYYKLLGKERMKRALALSNPDLPFDILSGRKRRKIDDYYRIELYSLFPSESRADTYFRQLFLKNAAPAIGKREIWQTRNN